MIYEPLPVGRICRKCGHWFPRAELKKNRNQPDGVERICLKCNSAEANGYYSDNRAKVLRHHREAYKQNPEPIKARNKRSREKHKKQIHVHVRAWQHKNKERVQGYKKKWRDEHPAEMRTYCQQRMARKARLPNTFTARDWRRCLHYWGFVCAYCGNQQGFLPGMNLTQEHFVPVMKGGGYVPENIIPACQSCNTSKSNRDPVEWLTERFGKRKARQILARIEAYFASLKS